MTTKVEEQVSWNLSEQVISEIGYLLQRGATYQTRGMHMNCFFCYKEILILIYHHLKKDQVERVTKIEAAMTRVMKELNRLSALQEEEDEFVYDSRVRDIKNKLKFLSYQRNRLIEKFRKSVLHYLDAYGYMMQRKQDQTRMF